MAQGTTLAVHRCRFVDHTPSAITALAFPPLPLPSNKEERPTKKRRTTRLGILVVGRANGNIELCEWTGGEYSPQSSQAWVVKKTLTGPFPSKVDSLALALRSPEAISADNIPSSSDLRLFSAGGGSELAEWDIERGVIKRSIPSQGGSIWSIAVNPASTLLALACEDGSIHILSIEDNMLVHIRRMDRVKSRILSLAWGPPKPKETKRSKNPKQSDSDTDSDDEGDNWADTWIVGGCSDSSLRKWDLVSGRVMDRMGTDKIRGERTLVWTVGVLGEGTIISGDSLGTVKFWDSRTCTQLQSFKAHGADVLALTISPDATSVFTSGVDQKVVQFTHVKVSQPATITQPSILSRSPTRWVQASSRRMHSHDVRALAIWPPYTPLPPSHSRRFPQDIAPVLASGGLDMSVVVIPAACASSTTSKVINPLSTSVAATFEDAYHRRLAYSSGAFGTSAVHVAKEARLLMCIKDSGLTIWRIPQHTKPRLNHHVDDAEGVAPTDMASFERVLDMDLSVHTNLLAGAISGNGLWVAVSDWYESKLFYLEHLPGGDLKPKRIRAFTSIIQSHVPNSSSSTPTGASSFVFSPDNTKLVVSTSISSYVLVLDLTAEDHQPKVLRRFDQHRHQDVLVQNRVVKGRKTGELKPTDKDDEEADGQDEGSDSDSDEEDPTTKLVSTTITRMAISTDGQWLASSDIHSRTHIFNLDSLKHHSILPTFSHTQIQALSFLPSSPSVLVLGMANNTIQVYDVESKSFPGWCKHLTSSLPQRFTQLHDPILGVTFDPGAASGKKQALFWGSTWLCKIQLDAEVGYRGFDKKRRRDKKRHNPNAVISENVGNGDNTTQSQQQNFKLVTHYRPILFADFLTPAELVVVERPLIDVLAKLPPAFFKPKYGAS